MNPDAINQADRCLSDAAKQAERKRVEEQTYDKLDVIACERTRMIAEALINQLTNADDGEQSDKNTDRINKLRDSSKLFEPVRDRKETAKASRAPSAEPAKKLLRELLEQANAQLRAEETKTTSPSAPSCDQDSGCQPKLSTKQIQTIVLQSASTKQDLEAQKPTEVAKENAPSAEIKEQVETEKPKTETPASTGKSSRATKTNIPGARKPGAQSQGNKNILSLISQSEAMVNDAVRKAHGTLKKIGAD